MNKPVFIQHYLFRLLFPPIWGVMIYILILLVFSDITSLSENFSPYELLLIIILSYLCFECLLFYNNKFLSKILAKNKKILWFAVFITSLILILIISYSIMYLYLKYILKISVYEIEANIIINLFLISAIIYNLMYYALVILLHQQQSLLQKEIQQLQHYETEIIFANKNIHAAFLFQSLEIINETAQQNPIKADQIVSKLAAIYRYRNQYPQGAITYVSEEITTTKNLIDILSIQHPNNIKLYITNNDGHNLAIPAECILFYIENMINSYLITSDNILQIEIRITEKSCQINHNHMAEKIMTLTIEELIKKWKHEFEKYNSIQIISICAENQIKNNILIP